MQLLVKKKTEVSKIWDPKLHLGVLNMVLSYRKQMYAMTIFRKSASLTLTFEDGTVRKTKEILKGIMI